MPATLTGDTEGDTNYLIAHGIPELMETCLAQVLSKKPDRPLETLIEKLTQKEIDIEKERIAVLTGKWEVTGREKNDKQIYHFKSSTELLLESYSSTEDVPSEVLQCSCIVNSHCTPWKVKVTMLKYSQDLYCIIKVDGEDMICESGVTDYPSDFTTKKTIFKKVKTEGETEK